MVIETSSLTVPFGRSKIFSLFRLLMMVMVASSIHPSKVIFKVKSLSSALQIKLTGYSPEDSLYFFSPDIYVIFLPFFFSEVSSIFFMVLNSSICSLSSWQDETNKDSINEMPRMYANLFISMQIIYLTTNIRKKYKLIKKECANGAFFRRNTSRNCVLRCYINVSRCRTYKCCSIEYSTSYHQTSSRICRI